MQFFQEAILEKYGFVRNAAMLTIDYSVDDPSFFIHSSGGMFVQLPNYYTNYYTNRSRHTSSNSMGGTSHYSSHSTVTTANPAGLKTPMLNLKHQIVRTFSDDTNATTPSTHNTSPSFYNPATNLKQDVSDSS